MGVRDGSVGQGMATALFVLSRYIMKPPMPAVGEQARTTSDGSSGSRGQKIMFRSRAAALH